MSRGLAPMPGSTVMPWNREQVDLIKRTIASKTTDDELALFLETARHLGLDPFAQQIYVVVREGERSGRRATIQISVDGYRRIASRSGEYEGQTPAQWAGPDGNWREVWLGNGPPAAARIGIYRRGFREPLYAVATWKEHSQRSPTWGNYPAQMLATAAERLALRKAFPVAGVGEPDVQPADEDLRPEGAVEVQVEGTWDEPDEDETTAGEPETEQGEKGSPAEGGQGPAEAGQNDDDHTWGSESPTPDPEPQPEQEPLEDLEDARAAYDQAEDLIADTDREDLGEPPTDEQWARALRVIGDRPTILRAYQAKIRPGESFSVDDVTKGGLARLILEHLGGRP